MDIKIEFHYLCLCLSYLILRLRQLQKLLGDIVVKKFFHVFF